MRRLFVVVAALALVPVVVPAKADATLGQRVTKLEAKLACIQRVPLVEFADYAWYGGADNPNEPTYAEADSLNPDSLFDQGPATGLDLGYGLGPDVWGLAIKKTSGCKAKFGVLANPFATRQARMMRARQLARVQ